MANDDWFDDEVGEILPANMRRLPLPRRVEKLPKKQDLDAITMALSILARERKQEPELVALLERYPVLLAEYLILPLHEKMKLEIFRMNEEGYFHDNSWNGDPIRNLSDRCQKNYAPQAAMIARKYRWAEQLTKMVDFYLEHHKDSMPFNNNYLRHNPELRLKFGTRGGTLVQNAYQNQIPVSDIVALVAYVRPEILNYYRPPGYKNNVREMKRSRK